MTTVLNGGPADRPNCLAGISRVTWDDAPAGQAGAIAPRRWWKCPRAAIARTSRRTAIYDFNWLSTTGTGIFLAAILSAFWLRIGVREFCSADWLDTVFKMRWALFTIACMLALAFVTKYSGSDATMGLAFTKHGLALSVLRADAGLAGRGADGFGHVVERAVRQLAADHGRAAWAEPGADRRFEQHGRRDGQDDRRPEHRGRRGGHGTRTAARDAILRFVFFHSVVLACLVGLLTLAQAYCADVDDSGGVTDAGQEQRALSSFA